MPFVAEGGKLRPCGSPLSILCYEPDYPPLSQKIQSITGITDELLKSQGEPRKAAFEKLLPLVEWADVVVAHKIAFDKTVLVSTAKLLGLEVPDREWLCTLTNFKFPEHITCHKLGHIAWELGIDVRAADLHRATNDCELLAKIINTFDFKDVLEYARQPWVYLRADCAGPWADKGVQNGIAKSLGFSYETVKGTDKPTWPKTWVGRYKASAVEAVKEAVRTSVSPFRVSVIEGIS